MHKSIVDCYISQTKNVKETQKGSHITVTHRVDKI
jgi:hypothetical protein